MQNKPASANRNNKPVRQKRPVVYAVVAVTIVLIAGFTGAWFYLQRMEKLQQQIVYSKPTKVAVGNNDYSVSSTYAVRTNGADADWARQNQGALEQVVKKKLMDADPKQVLAPGGLTALQESLRQASNALLQTDKVQEVIVTDYLYSSHDNE